MSDIPYAEIYNEIRQWFVEFTKQYDNNDPKIGHKFIWRKVHTEHVCELMKKFTEKEFFSEEDAWIALISARLHDSSRFEQTLLFNTYKDNESFDHGDRAVEVLKEKKVLARLSPETQNLVFTAIKYHNKKDTNIPDSLSKRELLFLNILRDVDKLDNIKEEIETRFPTYKKDIDELIKRNLVVDEKVHESFFRRECVDYKNIKTTLDRIFLVASWVFDLNTRTAFEMCKENDWFNIIFDFLPHHNKLLEKARKLVAQEIDDKLAIMT